jgi:inorganic pyrophosphatase
LPGNHAATDHAFFEHYKDLEPGKWAKVGDWHGAGDARKLIVDSNARASGRD